MTVVFCCVVPLLTPFFFFFCELKRTHSNCMCARVYVRAMYVYECVYARRHTYIHRTQTIQSPLHISTRTHTHTMRTYPSLHRYVYAIVCICTDTVLSLISTLLPSARYMYVYCLFVYTCTVLYELAIEHAQTRTHLHGRTLNCVENKTQSLQHTIWASRMSYIHTHPYHTHTLAPNKCSFAYTTQLYLVMFANLFI